MAKCTNCDNIILYNSRKCPHCGVKNPEYITLISIMPFNPFFFLKTRLLKIIGAALVLAAFVLFIVGFNRDAAGELLAFADGTAFALRFAIVAAYIILVIFGILLIACAIILFFSWVFFKVLSGEHKPRNCDHEKAVDGCYCVKCGLTMHDVEYCSCRDCGAVLNDKHVWHGHTCSICGAERRD